MEDNGKTPAFAVPADCISREGLTKLEYIATHVSVTSDGDNFSESSLNKISGREQPDSVTDPQGAIQWWVEIEAKLRVMKAKAILAEIEKNNP